MNGAWVAPSLHRQESVTAHVERILEQAAIFGADVAERRSAKH
jgi:hypothetical protein